MPTIVLVWIPHGRIRSVINAGLLLLQFFLKLPVSWSVFTITGRIRSVRIGPLLLEFFSTSPDAYLSVRIRHNGRIRSAKNGLLLREFFYQVPKA